MKKFLILLAAFYCSVYPQADDPGINPQYLEQSIRFSHLTNDNGLSQGFISSITQDNKGFMWFATAEGLNRYDGYSFKVFRFDAFDTAAIQENFVTELFNDKAGKLWVGSFSRGLSCYNKITESFFRFSSDPEKKNFIAGTRIYAIIEDTYAELPTYWIVTNSNVINQLVLLPGKRYLADPQSSAFPDGAKWIAEGYRIFHYSIIPGGSLNLLTQGYNVNTSETPTGKNSIVIDDKRNLWIGLVNREIIKVKLNKTSVAAGNNTKKGFQYSVWQPDGKFIQHIQLNYSSFADINEFDRTCLFKSHGGSIWAGVNNMLVRLTNENLHPVKEEYVLHPAKSSQSVLVDEIAEDTQGRLWIATTIGLFSFTPADSGLTYHPHSALNPESPIANFFSSVFIDAGNIVWCGSYGYGISYLDPRNEIFHHYNDVNKNFNVYDFEESNNGNLWVRKGYEEWLYYNRESNRFIKPPVNLKKYFFIKSLIEDKDGRLWFISEGKLYSAPGRGAAILVRGLKPDIQFIYEDSSGSIWGGSPSEVFRINYKTSEITNQYYLIHILDKNELPAFEISGMYNDENKRFWIISNAGLIGLDIASGKFKRYRSNFSSRTGLNNDDLISIHPDPFSLHEILWLGTKGGGLNRLDTRTGIIKYYTMQDGLPNNVIYSILGDKNDLWMSTNSGIACMKLVPDTLYSGRIVSKVKEFVNYDRSDGLQGNEFNSRSALKTRKGELIFGGLNGFNVFNPGGVVRNKHVPGIAITGMTVNYKKNDYNLTGSYLTRSLPETRSITLPYDQNTLTFEFAALDYASVSKNQFSYRLKEYNDQWSKPQPVRTATFTRIPPGRYILEVKGSSSSGVWNLDGVSFEIIITPPFWLRWWFIVLSAALFFLAIFFSIRWISIRKLKRNLLLLKKENEIRTKISRDLHDEIGSRVTQISLFSSLLAGSENDKKKLNWGIKNINEAASDIVTALDEVVWAINPVNDNINNFAGYVVQYTTDYLEKADVIIEYDVPDNFPFVNLASEKRHRLLMTVKEALSNIVKHSGAGKVNLKIEFNNQVLIIMIKDNGKGFASEDTRRFGNGLKLMENRVEETGGSFSISSMLNEGTEIIIRLKIEDG